MIKLIFKNVGQGDSILLKWLVNGVEHIGILDCNLHDNVNPILVEIKSAKIKFIDFIILSHLHADHFSGMGELLDYCLDQKIKVGKFYHTFENEYFKILSELLVTQNNMKLAQKFLSSFGIMSKQNMFGNIDRITYNTMPILFDGGEKLVFLAPSGKDYFDYSHAQAKYINKQTSALPDLNNLSTVIKITDNKSALLLTADTTNRQLKRLTNKISEMIICAQIPHHGSKYNHCQEFWDSLVKKKDCCAIFSVGDVKKDRLPNKSVVEHFYQNGYDVKSTNFVYGIKEQFSTVTLSLVRSHRLSIRLNAFSTQRRISSPVVIPSKYSGDIAQDFF